MARVVAVFLFSARVPQDVAQAALDACTHVVKEYGELTGKFRGSL